MPKTNFKNQPKTCSRGASALGGDAPRARTPSPKKEGIFRRVCGGLVFGHCGGGYFLSIRAGKDVIIQSRISKTKI